MQTFETTAPIAAVLDVPAGSVRFIAADRTDTTVEVLAANASKGRDVKAAEGTEVAYAAGVLRVTAPEAKNQILGASGSIEVTVQLPAGSSVEVKASGAEVRGVGRLGDVTVVAAQGPVKLDETAGTRISVQDGDIEIGRLGGDAEIGTRKGDIRVAEAVRGTVTLRTEQGDVSVGAARGASATLDAGTSYGRVANTLMNAEGAAAALNIHATTTHGDITARSL